MKAIDLTGKKFHMLTVVSPNTPGYWNAVCDCGNDKIVSGASLRSGNTKSCGCLVRMNSGRPSTHLMRPEAFIPYIPFLDSAAPALNALRTVLKDYGVIVKNDKCFYVSGVSYGPYSSSVHALFYAMTYCVKSNLIK